MKHEEEVKIRFFTDLITWKEGHKLVLAVYKETKYFPSEETYGLISQMRRAVVSVTSCIAEGFSRKTYKDKANFYQMSQGSLTELQNQLLIAKDLGYLGPESFKGLNEQSITVHKLINGLIKATNAIRNS